ncbi:hypothetical protein Tco_1370353 [Tanacetum coccineum]
MMWYGCLEATANKEQQGGDLFTSSLQGGDGGACKLLGRLLGDVIEVLESCLVASVGYKRCLTGKKRGGLVWFSGKFYQWINMKSWTINQMSKKLHDTNPEITLGEVGKQFLVSE